ncbi:MAG: BON domain-containing protein [Methylococcales bacterium]|nr:BON domain-containing protein [Methylococcales bacterium]
MNHKTLIILSILLCLCGCITEVWTGASLLYDRHHVYKKMGDYSLSARVNHLLFSDNVFKCRGCVIDVATFNDDVLLAGHVPTERLHAMLAGRLAHLSEYRHLYNEVVVARIPSQTVTDTWITTKIRSHLLADSRLDPNAFKVITTDGIVYLMGEVMADQARRVVYIAQNTAGVRKVVKLMHYFTIK